MENKTVFLNKVNASLLVTAVLIVAIVLIMLNNQSDTQESQQTIADLLGVSSADNLTVAPATKLASVESLVDGLLSRLKEQPDDVEGWVLLARSYHHIQRGEEAKKAFEQAKSLGYKGQPPFISDTTHSHLPSSPLPGNSFLEQYLSNKRFAKNTTLKVNTIKQNSSAKINSSAEIKLRLSLIPDLTKTLDPDLPVYIFARAFNKNNLTSGPPLAAIRLSVSDLPVEITLNDEMAMIPGKTISSVEQIVVGARVSVTGNPMKQIGDFEQLSAPIPSNHQNIINLTIGFQIKRSRPG